MKKLGIILFVIFIFVVGGLFVSNSNFNSTHYASASASWGTINYVSLGDSIAEGYGLSGYNNKDANGFVDSSYAKAFYQYLSTKYTNVNGVSYANSGDTSLDLFKKLNNNTKVINSVKAADVITICIGANDILEKATNTITNSLLNGVDIGTMLSTGIVEAALDEGLDNFSTNFEMVLNRLKELNPDASVIFLDVYNPYFHYQDENVSEGVIINGIREGDQYFITTDDLNSIGRITETYISGGTNSNEDLVLGLNERMLDLIYLNENYERVYPNSYLVGYNEGLGSVLGVNSAFKNYDGDYSVLINERITKDEESVYSLTQIATAVDPHPTALGHRVIKDLLSDYFGVNFCVVNVDFGYTLLNGQTRDSFINKLNSNLAIPSSYTEAFGRLILDGWYNVGFNIQYTNETIIENDFYIYAKWQNLFVVSFNSNGGTSVQNQKIIGGDKATAPLNPTKTNGDLFVYWYYLEDDQEIVWNFDTRVVNSNVSLTAKWAKVTCSTPNKKTQTIKIESLVDGLEGVEYSVSVSPTKADIKWFVNGEEQKQEVLSTFTFIPPTAVGNYEVYCTVNGNETKRDTVTVKGVINARTIEIHTDTIKRGNNYTVSLNHKEIYNKDNISWYVAYDGENEIRSIKYAEGIDTFTFQATETCRIYAKYGNITSNSISIEVKPAKDLTVFFAIGGCGLIVVFAVYLTLLSKRKYDNRTK